MIEFSETQKKTVAAGLTLVAFAVIAAFVVLLGWGVVMFLQWTATAVVPVILGVFLSFLFKPYYLWWKARLRNPLLSVAAMLLSVLVPLGALAWFAGALVVSQCMALAQAAPAVVERLSGWVAEHFPNARAMFSQFGLDEGYLLFFSDPAKFTAGIGAQLFSDYGMDAMRMGAGALHCLSFAGTALLTLVFFLYFLTRAEVRGEDLARQLPFFKDGTKAFVAEQVDAFADVLVSFFRRQVLICLIEGVLYGMGFVFVGLPYGFVLGFTLGMINLVPFLGTVLVLPLALPLAMFGDGGSLLRLVGVSCVWLAGQFLDGYLITPKIQGDKTGLGFAGVIFSFLFWGVVFRSPLGLLLAIPLSAFVVAFWRALKARYIKGVV